MMQPSKRKHGKERDGWILLRKLCGGLGITLQQFFSPGDGPALTPTQRECLSLFRILTPEEQSLALTYMKGLAHKL